MQVESYYGIFDAVNTTIADFSFLLKINLTSEQLPSPTQGFLMKNDSSQ